MLVDLFSCYSNTNSFRASELLDFMQLLQSNPVKIARIQNVRSIRITSCDDIAFYKQMATNIMQNRGRDIKLLQDGKKMCSVDIYTKDSLSSTDFVKRATWTPNF